MEVLKFIRWLIDELLKGNGDKRIKYNVRKLKKIVDEETEDDLIIGELFINKEATVKACLDALVNYEY